VPTGSEPTRLTIPSQHFYPPQSNIKQHMSCLLEPSIKYSLLENGLSRHLVLFICVINVVYELFSFCQLEARHKKQSIGPSTASGQSISISRIIWKCLPFHGQSVGQIQNYSHYCMDQQFFVPGGHTFDSWLNIQSFKSSSEQTSFLIRHALLRTNLKFNI
jgi:hypothetical protein